MMYENVIYNMRPYGKDLYSRINCFIWDSTIQRDKYWRDLRAYIFNTEDDSVCPPRDRQYVNGFCRKMKV